MLCSFVEDVNISKKLNFLQIPNDAGGVRAVTCNEQGLMLVGTKSNRILYGGFDKQFDTIVHVSVK